MQKIQSHLYSLLCVLLFISCSEKRPATTETVTVNETADTTLTSTTPEQNTEASSQIPGNPAEKLLGDWLVVNVIGEHKDLNMGLVYTWTKDGVMKMEREFSIVGNYTATEALIVWKTDEFEFTYDYTINGDIMTLIPRNSGHTYTLKKR
jgi:hypothetical protein